MGDRLPTDALQDFRRVPRDDFRKFGVATNIQSCRNPKHWPAPHLEALMRGLPIRRRPISGVAHPNPDDYQRPLGRAVRRQNTTEAQLDNENRQSRRGGTASPNRSPAPDRIVRPAAAARRNAIAAPNSAHQLRQTPLSR